MKHANCPCECHREVGFFHCFDGGCECERPPPHIPDWAEFAILHDTISQANKLHLIAGARSRGEYVEYRFAGEPMRTRMSVQLEPDGPWREVKSFEFDVRPGLKFNREKG